MSVDIKEQKPRRVSIGSM